MAEIKPSIPLVFPGNESEPQEKPPVKPSNEGDIKVEEKPSEVSIEKKETPVSTGENINLPMPPEEPSKTEPQNKQVVSSESKEQPQAPSTNTSELTKKMQEDTNRKLEELAKEGSLAKLEDMLFK